MPPILSVKPLFIGCLEVIYERFQNVAIGANNGKIQKLRKVALSSLHAGIRQQLVRIATSRCRYDAWLLLKLLTVFMDKGIKHLDHSAGDPSAQLELQHCADLLLLLENCDVTCLQEFTVKVRLDGQSRSDLETVSFANLHLHRVLRNGLATSLRVLVLRSVCDNEILRLLGQHCPHLKLLDATLSWLVDDNGIRQLCFKEPEFHSLPFDGFHQDGNAPLNYFFSVEESALNPCCKKLHEVRIQDTNTSELGVIMLLLFLPNLRSLGGFIYYRNIGDAIMSLLDHKGGNLRLTLTDLWDTCLSPQKAAVLSTVTPNLMRLYTRGCWISSVTAFKNLTALTVDFDFTDFTSALEDYLLCNGAMLKKLILVDQNHPLDLSVLAETCHSLEELQAKLDGCLKHNEPVLPKLHICAIRVTSVDTLTSLMISVPSICALKVKVIEDSFGEDVEFFFDSLILDVLVSRTQLDHLEIFRMHGKCYFGAVTVQALISACPKLKVIGDLYDWDGITEKEIRELAKFVRESNLDLVLDYKGQLLPYRNKSWVST